MNKTIPTCLLFLMSASVGFCQFGGLLGGGKKSSAMDKDAYMEQGKQLIQGYALLQAAVLEVGAAQALAENDSAAAELYTARANALKKDPSSKNFEQAKQSTKEIVEKQKDEEKRSVEYSEKGKEALKATLPKSFATVAGATALGIMSVDWLKEYPNQLKAAGTFGKLKLVKELKVPMMIAKELPSSLVTIPKTLKAITGNAKKQGVDVKAAEKKAAEIEK
jgi:hypothetical protein